MGRLRSDACAVVQPRFGDESHYQGMSDRAEGGGPGQRCFALGLGVCLCSGGQVVNLTSQSLQMGFAEKEVLQALCGSHGAGARLRQCKSPAMHGGVKVSCGLQ